MSKRIEKTIAVELDVMLPDTDGWADEYGQDADDLDSIQSDVGAWLNNAIHTVLTEMPGAANSLRVTRVDVTITKSELTDVLPQSDQHLVVELLTESAVAEFTTDVNDRIGKISAELCARYGPEAVERIAEIVMARHMTQTEAVVWAAVNWPDCRRALAGALT